MKTRVFGLALAVALVAALNGRGGAAAPQSPAEGDGVGALLQRLEQVAQSGRPDEYVDLLTERADRAEADEFARSEFPAGVTRAVVRERDREPLRGTLPGDGYRLSLDVFIEFAARARSESWRLDVKRAGGSAADDSWRIAAQQRLTPVQNLYRLSLDPMKQFEARDLKIAVEDLDLVLAEGSLFVVDSAEGPTGVLLLGRGDVRFEPTPEIEKGQLKIFCGAATLQTRFDAAYLRMNPQDVAALVDLDRLEPRPVDSRDIRRAEEVFREEVSKSYSVDMSDLSRELWSILPAPGDFLAEIRTPRYDTLTYVRSGNEPEDISFFDRKRRHNISVYASEANRARFGSAYNEDDLASYDVLGYDVDVSLTPDRLWIEGRVRLQLRVLATSLNSITLRLAEPLVVQSIGSDLFGRLPGLRIHNQNTIIINLPSTLLRDDDLLLTVAYAGRLEPQREDAEAVQGAPRAPQGIAPDDGMPAFQPERSYLFSSRSYWYPQAPITDYATASIRITVPSNYDCVASGTLDAGFPMATTGREGGQSRKTYLFTTSQPLRYLAFVVSRFTRLDPTTVTLDDGGTLTLTVQANPRQVRPARELAERAAEILRFYDSLIGEAPYPAFTLALLESDLPGGHSPGFFAALNQPLPNTPFVWRNDPASFDDFPEFFLAHEIAHQWWGQAVGWRNYHEQWISEGFAQYFAALYAQHHRGEETFTGVLRQFKRWAMQQSDQGPIRLGYRLGHVRGDSRIFRALVYNKSAAVLHMLRRLVGDDAFFTGVRRFYAASRFKKTGAEEFRAAMESVSGRPLARFFNQWIDGSTLPRAKVSSRIEQGAGGARAVIHVEQLGEVFDFPLTVTITSADRQETQVVVPVGDRIVDVPIPLAGPVRSVDINRDDGTLVEFVKN